MVNVIHIVNQFFAGLGGEEKAGIAVGVAEEASGAARGLQTHLRDQGKVLATIYYGDNYFHEHREEAKAAILNEVRSRKPQVVVAGPAFNSGRYGLSCVEISNAIAETLGIPCVTAMHVENQAVESYREYRSVKVFLLPTKETAAGMNEALIGLARFVFRLDRGGEVGPADKEGYLDRGIRRLELPAPDKVIGPYEEIRVLSYPGAPLKPASGPLTFDARDMLIGGVDNWGRQTWTCRAY